MAKKGTTHVLGYYNGAKWPIQIVFPKLNVTLTLEPGQFICDSTGRKINDPLFEPFAKHERMLKRELSDVPVPICRVDPEAPRRAVSTNRNEANVFKEYAKGFKQISVENLLKPDEHPSYPSRLRGDKWVRECLKPQLDSSVPVEVAFLFEVARGSMVYGIYFLPLAALATEQGFRVLEAGARHRCKQLGLLKRKSAKATAFPDSPFVDVVAALQKAGTIPKADLDVWRSMVTLRNNFSHSTSQSIRARHEAIEQLAYIAELLNRLFK